MSVANLSALFEWERATGKRHGVGAKQTKILRKKGEPESIWWVRRLVISESFLPQNDAYF